MAKLSVLIITFNEANNITDCLASVSFADEVVVLDSGSKDGTADIARDCGAQVVVSEGPWPGFGPQKNRALGLASNEWVLSIDADERVTAELAKQIQHVIHANVGVAYEVPRLTQFCGQWIRHSGWAPDHVLRLFKRDSARFSDDLVHERVITSAVPNRLFSPLLHYSYPTPNHYWRKLEQYSQAWAQQRYELGQKTSMFRAGLAGLAAFLRSYFFQRGFLDGSMGFAVCVMQAQAAFGKYFELFCLQKRHEK